MGHVQTKSVAELIFENGMLKKQVDSTTTSLRDKFAMAALTGLIAHSDNFIRHGINTDTLAIYSYKAADAMLEARAK